MPEENASNPVNAFLPVGRIAEILGDANTRTLPVNFFVHDGSKARPSNIPRNTRVLYVHKTDGAFVLTNSDKLGSWSGVTLYLPLDYAQFRTFARSKSIYAR